MRRSFVIWVEPMTLGRGGGKAHQTSKAMPPSAASVSGAQTLRCLRRPTAEPGAEPDLSALMPEAGDSRPAAVSRLRRFRSAIISRADW